MNIAPLKRQLSAPVSLQKSFNQQRPVLSPSHLYNQVPIKKQPQRKKRRAEPPLVNINNDRRKKPKLNNNNHSVPSLKPNTPIPTRKHTHFYNTHNSSKPIDPDLLDWRDTDKIEIPAIQEITPEDWPDDDPGLPKSDLEFDFEETNNESYYVRHLRAEKREQLFYARLQQWRQQWKEEEKNDYKNGELKVSTRPRGPWQF
eukprot:UN28227